MNFLMCFFFLIASHLPSRLIRGRLGGRFPSIFKGAVWHKCAIYHRNGASNCPHSHQKGHRIQTVIPILKRLLPIH